ncbi:MAG: preprotein translocase subunit SecY [Candidatus Pacebacteria bacterium]|nr:preprotein translocase subunit SecY [Candidatus Paceibacterota bacterium]
MLKIFIHKLKLTFSDKALRNKIFFVLGALVIFRALAAIPIPGVDTAALANFLANNEFLGMLNMFSGGGLMNLSIVMLGVGPYITASIIMQLSTVMSTKMKKLQTEEGEAGRLKFTQYSRYLTVPLAAVQGFSFLTLLQRQGVVAQMDIQLLIINVFVIIAGSMLLMWVGELVTEFGIGNGVSLIIFAGIVAGLPNTIGQLLFNYDPSQIPMYIGFSALVVLVTAAVVFITEAERPVPITYSRQARQGSTYGAGAATYLPLRVNQAGVIPIIFALSLLLMPQMMSQVLAGLDIVYLSAGAQSVAAFLANTINYAIIYFILVFAFTYFYTAVTFDPDQIATNLQKSGGYVHGLRPGEATAEYLGHVITRITLFGALFLAVIAVLPVGLQMVTGNTSLAIGGTALLIAVSVVLDLVKKVDAQVSVREY